MGAICEKIRNSWDLIEAEIAYLERCEPRDFASADYEKAERLALRLITIAQRIPADEDEERE